MNTRVFVERLNQGLDDIGVPTLVSERVDVFAKLLDVPRFKAEAILNGRLPIDQHILEKIAKEKAGIIKEGVPVVVGRETPWGVIEEVARERGSEFVVAGKG